MTGLTRTDVVNLALAHLGDSRINDFEDRKPAAANARDQWEIARHEALSAYEWSFASRISALTRNASVPAAGFAYRYDQPVGLIRLIAVSHTTAFDRRSPFRDWWSRDGFIESDAAALWADYVYDHTTVGTWTAPFVDYMAASLAMRMNPKVTTSVSAGQSLYQIKKDALGIARARDAQGQPIQHPPRGRWFTALRGGYGRSV